MATDQSPTAPAWYTIRDAAAYLNVGEPTIYRWMRDGRITYRKVGDSTRFLKEDLDAVVDVFPSTRDVSRLSTFCPVCHHPELVEGDIRSTSRVDFHPRRTRFWSLQESRVALRASMCTRCGAVVLNGDTAKLAALRTPGAEPSEPEPQDEPPQDPAPSP